jgi:hypothetical protein
MKPPQSALGGEFSTEVISTESLLRTKYFSSKNIYKSCLYPARFYLLLRGRIDELTNFGL